jgi:hypothetical protein
MKSIMTNLDANARGCHSGQAQSEQDLNSVADKELDLTPAERLPA